MENITINPCKACLKKYQDKDINDIDQCCYDTAAAFAGALSNNQLLGTDAAKNCIQCVRNSKVALGKSDCDLRLGAYPIWNQSAHFFPSFLEESNGNVQVATSKCMQECKNTRYPFECMDNCITDSNAVQSVENFEYTTSSSNSPPDKPQYYITLILLLLIFFTLTVYFIKIVFSNKFY